MYDNSTTTQHRLFVREARDAVRRSLFYLGMLYQTGSASADRAIASYGKHAIRQVNSVLHGVVRREPWSAVSIQPAHPPTEEREHAESEILEVQRSWDYVTGVIRSIEEKMSAGSGPPYDRIHDLRTALRGFLLLSRSKPLLDQAINHELTALWRWLGKHLAWMLTTAFVIWIVWKVEAVNGLLQNEGLWSVYCLTLLAIPQIYWKTRTTIGRRSKPRTIPLWYVGGEAFWRADCVEPGPLVERWPQKMSAIDRAGFGPLLRWVIVVVAFFGLLALAYRVGSPALVALILITLVCGIWFFRTRWPDKMSILHVAIQGQFLKLCLYGVWWFVALGIVFLARGGSTLTVFLILSLLYGLLIGAYLVDFWDFLDPNPVRLLLLLAAAVCAVGVVLGTGREVFLVLVLLGLAWSSVGFCKNKQRPLRLVLALSALALLVINSIGWHTHSQAVWRLDDVGEPFLTRVALGEWPFVTNDLPVVVMSISGGGSRAAVYGGLVLRALNEDSLRDVANRLEAISSVSGGSLASAAYIARLLSTHYPDVETAPILKRREVLQDLDEALASDFLLPTLKGALTPFTTRGAAIEEAWRTGTTRLGNYTVQDLAAVWRQSRDRGDSIPPFPLPLFNTSTLDGHDVVISPLAKDFYTQAFLHDQASDAARNPYRAHPDPTWVYYRDGIYGLEDILGAHDISLASAVRASASFPFGFPLVRIRTDSPLFFNIEHNYGRLELTDGGALSNSGMWSLYHMLINAKDSLLHRGVLLIIVDASKMPVQRKLGRYYTSLLGTIGDQSPIGQNLHGRMLDMLEQVYGPRLAVVQIDLTPRRSRNIMTTWALDNASLDTLRATFSEQWNRELPSLLAKWEFLKSPDSGDPPALIDRDRPPLD